ncbi:hypothetical protein ACFFSW_17745 [Saccharothrix longispora]|uniref:Uncharacterized protein n=1 Tax=Saccharothrix longispora TaxID=33920 RepID=A0ABU1PSF7_9PSEU|nr:hypothetical protein [Saccharothrix longispora]MDR6593580.1 hypothetical protein [Saccharothrix longispora]
MKQSDQPARNEVGGDVGTSIQAGSISGDVHLHPPAGPLWRRRLLLPAVAAATAVGTSATALVALTMSDEPARSAPPQAVFITTPATETTGTVSHAPVVPTVGAVRPMPTVPATRASGSVIVVATTTTITTTTTAFAPSVAPPPVDAVRSSSELEFGSFNLDLSPPKRVDGRNVWTLTPGRLHGDENYWLAEWFGGGVPGQAECVAEITARGTRDAENLAAGSTVCGSTPEGRIFRIDVLAVDRVTITGQVVVWG